MTAPRRSILDPGFRYTNAVDTDISKTFKRIRKAQALQKKREQAQESADTTVLISNFNQRRAKERT